MADIPTAEFIENVEEYLAKNHLTADDLLTKLQEMYNRYKMFESKISQSRLVMKSKIPDIRKTLETVKFLNEKKGATDAVTTNFELASNVYAKASLHNTGSVFLWLGVNVMVEYSFDEAIELLGTNLTTAEATGKILEERLAHIRDQITTTEVNIARVYNYDIKIRRATGTVAAASS